MDDQAERQSFQDLLPQMLAVLGQSLNRGEETAAQEMLELFIELAESQPRFLKRYLPDVATAMIQVTARHSLCARPPMYLCLYVSVHPVCSGREGGRSREFCSAGVAMTDPNFPHAPAPNAEPFTAFLTL